jgi:hypothetical protein
VPPRSVLVRSVGLTGGQADATGDSAAADASAPADQLKGNIELLVFQLAQSSGTSGTPAAPAAATSPGAQVR